MTAGSENEQVSQGQISTMSESGSTPSQVVTALQREHAEWVAEVSEAYSEVTAIVPREHITAVCAALKAGTLKFDFLADLCGFDRGPEEEPRFEVNYHLFSTIRHHRVRLKVVLAEDDIHVPTDNDLSTFAIKGVG